MRVISGLYGGRKLQSPGGGNIRPTSDIVKEALFSMIGSRVSGAVCIDLFAGTGSLGIEALSRGALHCWFCDSAAQSIRLLRENLKALGIEKAATVMKGDFRRTLDRIAASGTVADILFADPPYAAGYYEEIMHTPRIYGMIKPGGLIVVERDAAFSPEHAYEGLERLKTKRYGKTWVDLFERTSE